MHALLYLQNTEEIGLEIELEINFSSSGFLDQALQFRHPTVQSRPSPTITYRQRHGHWRVEAKEHGRRCGG